MSRTVAVVVAVVAGIALAAGGTTTLVTLASPDRGMDRENAPAPNGVDGGTVDYGTSGK